jgi:hypothetical protein
VVSLPPVLPLQPERLEMSGKATALTVVWVSLAVALRRKEPVPVER